MRRTPIHKALTAVSVAVVATVAVATINAGAAEQAATCTVHVQPWEGNWRPLAVIQADGTRIPLWTGWVQPIAPDDQTSFLVPADVVALEWDGHTFTVVDCTVTDYVPAVIEGVGVMPDSVVMWSTTPTTDSSTSTSADGPPTSVTFDITPEPEPEPEPTTTTAPEVSGGGPDPTTTTSTTDPEWLDRASSSDVTAPATLPATGPRELGFLVVLAAALALPGAVLARAMRRYL